LRAFLAFETFLEEAFALYSLGKTAPKGRTPQRFTFPPTRSIADEWIIPEGRQYASWDALHVSNRAERYFRNGYPFSSILRAHQNALSEVKKIRNAIAHDSTSAQEKFKGVVRSKLGILPPGTNVGNFLVRPIPHSAPPQTFLEWYVEKLELIVQRIIPT
jgi:hypothetical protein